tara:strand:+ start:17722 stop:18354 length:633 start_codon:yes stop_codon:yes gene_type:complete
MKKKKIVIFGNGNQCKIIKQEIQKRHNLKILAIYDYYDDRIILSKEFNKKINLKSFSKIDAITAVGDNKNRQSLVKIVEKKFKKCNWITLISKDSIIAKNVKIGVGTVIVSGAVINTNSSIGDHCIINTSSSIDHDTKIGNFSTISPKATLAGNVKIGNNVFIGMSSSIKEKVCVNNNAIVGAMSFVNRDCVKNCTYFGIPARKIKKNKS